MEEYKECALCGDILDPEKHKKIYRFKGQHQTINNETKQVKVTVFDDYFCQYCFTTICSYIHYKEQKLKAPKRIKKILSIIDDAGIGDDIVKRSLENYESSRDY